MKILVFAPHPDDEILGVGGTLSRAASMGHECTVVIVTRGGAPLFDEDLVERGRAEALAAHELIGVRRTEFFDFPAAHLDSIPHHQLNRAMTEIVDRLQPDVVFVPFRGDVHLDHRLVFDSALVAVRPTPGRHVRAVYAYETLSETNWYAAPSVSPGFFPNMFVSLGEHLERKIEAMNTYRSQVREWPHERSVEALRALALHRGATVGVEAAEAFMTIRNVYF